jgi:arylsulfatase
MPNPERPNVLIVYTDQHRFDCLGCCGNPDVRTPNIDRLATEGVRFSHAFTCFPVCTPARYSLVTGVPVHVHGGFARASP